MHQFYSEGAKNCKTSFLNEYSLEEWSDVWLKCNPVIVIHWEIRECKNKQVPLIFRIKLQWGSILDNVCRF